MTNPLQHLYGQFNSGNPKDKLRDLPKFPLMIDVETTNACNFRCNFCPVGLGMLTRATGFMSSDTWRSMVDECEPHGTALRIIGWGENLLHPKITEFITYASAAGLLTHLNTNASKLTPKFCEMLVDAGLSSVKFSFQGLDRETYAEARQIDFFDGMLSAIQMMCDARGASAVPFISASTSITSETPEQEAIFRSRIEPLVDQLSIGHTTFDFLDGSAVRLRPKQKALFERAKASQTLVKRHPVPCPEVYGKLSIAWDGIGRVCCNDWDSETDLGKIGEATIAGMWRHGTIEAYRERLSRGEYTGKLCGSCYDYQDLTKG